MLDHITAFRRTHDILVAVIKSNPPSVVTLAISAPKIGGWGASGVAVRVAVTVAVVLAIAVALAVAVAGAVAVSVAIELAKAVTLALAVEMTVERVATVRFDFLDGVDVEWFFFGVEVIILIALTVGITGGNTCCWQAVTTNNKAPPNNRLKSLFNESTPDSRD
jgi:hypothetical protein